MNSRTLTRILAGAFVVSLLWTAFLVNMMPLGICDSLWGRLEGYQGDANPRTLVGFIGPMLCKMVTDALIFSAAPMSLTCLASLSLLAAIDRGWISPSDDRGRWDHGRGGAASHPGPKCDHLDEPLAKS